ncbi:uncharacterized protein Gasu_02070 [Galdieria sulphuraria]|uniref:Peptidase S54 rhomboid domain-containing protein n=1 Tax=Galdieria sulphuraria TaxID=130081 RepID=M2WAE9_GALSU|nr:uncharacterized protein Gasu_02070 [Galdieria sulphuraria]EME32856.1 hypothetical protein Gasu_02070 [Galdieria sulphuraria]|eukprot:XP_005709376.1 hypothetical protein Gasu_02070 [Galdieria sulphuraria]
MVRWNTSQILLVCSVLFLAYVTNPSESSFWTYIREKVGVESVGEKRNIRNIAQPLKWVDGILKSVFGLHRLPVRSRLKGIDLLIVTLLFYGNEPAFIGVFGIWIPLPRIISFLRNLRFHAWMLKATLFERVQAANLLWNPYELIVMLSTVFYLCWYLSPAFMRKHFTLSWHNIRQGRLWCIILCHLSQNSIFQLFRTLNSYYVLIPLLVRLIGLFHFYSLCLFGMLTASATTLTIHYKQAAIFSSSTPQGLTYTLFSAVCILFPQKFRLGILGFPISPFESFLLHIVMDFLEGMFNWTSNDFAAQLGGAVGAWLYTTVVL